MRTRILFAVLLLLALPAAQAQDPAQTLQDFLDATQTLAGNFEQQQLDEQGQAYETSSGAFYLQRPGRFRWDYTQPYAQHVISDGVTLWHYDPDLSQVLLRRVGEGLSATPAVLLSGGGDLRATFDMTRQPEQDGLTVIALTPRAEEAEFQSATLAMDGATPAWLEIVDPLGGTTRIRFIDVLSNVQLKPDLFTFDPPPGVEVVGE